ncbi:MAG: putative C-S lyase [Akkermansiaceae bacterium]|nr:putative C-S lyase [Akkermansiaceae bacterium]NNM31097.1 putative C-S lyase [Akkermansiaceae bacterium]
MMSDFDAVIPRRGTGSLKWDRRPDLDPFWVADMDFASPPAVVEALRERVAHGVFGYPVAHPALVEALVAYLAERHGAQVPADHLAHLGGLVPALSLAGRAFAQPGEAMLTATPVYPPFLGVHRDHNLQLLTTPHVQDGGRWTFDWEHLERTVTAETRIFLLCHPQNPLGRVFPKEEVVRVAEFCARHDLVLVSDEIHCDLVLDEEATPFVSALHLPAELLARTVVLMAPSKTYNIAGLGYSFAVIPDETLRRKFTQARGHILPEINCLAFHAAEAAYRHGEAWRQDLLAYLRGNRDLLTDFVRSRLPGVVVPDIEATYLAWLDFRPAGLEEPAAHFEKQAGLFLSDGRFFGSPGHARLNFGCPRAALQDALDRIAGSLAAD